MCGCGERTLIAKVTRRDNIKGTPLKYLSVKHAQQARCRVEPGQRYGRLTVLYEYDILNRNRRFMCRCDCGVEKPISAMNLLMKKEATVSCGCYKRDQTKALANSPENIERMRQLGYGKFVHGHCADDSLTKTYNTWMAMRRRCGLIAADQYHLELYAERGIKVCERWQHSFENFLEDMGLRPEGLTLDRINNFGNYTPENCRWATNKEQSANTRLAYLPETNPFTNPFLEVLL